MPGPGGHHGGPGGPGGPGRGPGGPGMGDPRMGGHLGGFRPMGHRPPPPPPPYGGPGRPPRRGCCGCLFPVIAVMGVVVAAVICVLL